MTEIASAEFVAEVHRARTFLRDALHKIKSNRDNNANQARAIDLRDQDNITSLATLWETSHAYSQCREYLQPALDILEQVDAFHAGFMHGDPGVEEALTKRVQFLEKLISDAADDAGLAHDEKYDTSERVVEWLVEQARRRENLSGALRSAAVAAGLGDVKDVYTFVGDMLNKAEATRKRADQERAALEKIAGMLGLEVAPGSSADAFVEAVRRRTHETVNPARPEMHLEPGVIIAGAWSGAPTDDSKTYVGKFIRKSDYDTVSIERPVLETGDAEQDAYWRIVVTDLKRHTVRKATTDETGEYFTQMDNLG